VQGHVHYIFTLSYLKTRFVQLCLFHCRCADSTLLWHTWTSVSCNMTSCISLGLYGNQYLLFWILHNCLSNINCKIVSNDSTSPLHTAPQNRLQNSTLRKTIWGHLFWTEFKHKKTNLQTCYFIFYTISSLFRLLQ
jgi:hypothetical protein